MEPVVVGNEYAAESPGGDDPGVERAAVIIIEQQRPYLAMRESTIRSGKCRSGIFALQNSSAVSRQQQAAGIARIEINIIDHHTGRGHQMEALAAIDRLP